MKIILAIIFFIYLSNCSFDTKSGIWQNNNKIDAKRNDRFKDFITLNTGEKLFNEVIELKKNQYISFLPPKRNNNWKDEYYKDTNNLDNFTYNNSNELLFKSKKLSKYKIGERLLFFDGILVVNDEKGNIIFYSVESKKTIFKFNFYKKRLKKITKKLNMVLENEVVYVSDNIGYIYAINFESKKILWAKNYKIPFRSNIKIIKNKIVLSDQDNNLYILNKSDGIQTRIIPTEEVILKNNFVNSIAHNTQNLFFLNTYGSLYSLSNQSFKINWFVNLNQSMNLNISNLFNSNPVIAYKDRLIISSDPYLYILNSTNGSTVLKKTVTSIIKPVISSDKIYLINNDNLLICIDILSGNIIYSLDVSKKIADFLKTKKKTITIKTLSIANNNILIFLENSFVVKFNSKARIQSIDKLKEKIESLPIFIDGSMIFINKKNKLVVID